MYSSCLFAASLVDQRGGEEGYAASHRHVGTGPACRSSEPLRAAHHHEEEEEEERTKQFKGMHAPGRTLWHARSL